MPAPSPEVSIPNASTVLRRRACGANDRESRLHSGRDLLITCMSLWTRKGYLVPLLWLLGFVVIYWADRSVPGTIPEKWIVTAGHILGTIFVAAFAITWGGTTTKEIIDVASGEKQTVSEPHLFLIFPAKIWAVILIAAMGLMFFQPPPKSNLDKAFFQTSKLEKKLKQAGAEAKNALTGAPVMREWENAQGKKLTAKCVGMVFQDGSAMLIEESGKPGEDVIPKTARDGKQKVILQKEDGEKVYYDFDKLSTDDKTYVRSKFKGAPLNP
jgi:hypothetical protein